VRPKGPWHPATIGTADNGRKALRLDSADVTDYREMFAAEGMDGSGIDWQHVLSPALRHLDKASWSLIDFDSDSEGFVATAKDPAPLEVLGQLILGLLKNHHSLERAIHDHESS
jgi:hypothetical protein